MKDLRLFVPGIPAPQGSTRAFVRENRAVVVHANKNTMPWRKLVSDIIIEEMDKWCPDHTPNKDPYKVTITFVMPPPKRLGRRRPPHITKPDLDKLVRAILDAATGLVWIDDSQVTDISATKQYGDTTGALIRIQGQGDLPT